MVATFGVGAPSTAAEGAREEALLVEALDDVREGRLDDAIRSLERSLERAPNFRLARLVYADLLAAKSGVIPGFGGKGAGRRIAELRDEAQKRLRRHRIAVSHNRVPSAVLEFAPGQRRAVVVDVEDAALYLFENVDGAPRLVSHYYVSIGKNGAMKRREGDQRTPVGVYFTTGRIASRELPDFYGAGAFPVNYPNEWDRRLERTGYGIWIHGVPSDTYARPPRASDGCMAMANVHFSSLWDRIEQDATPVIIASSLAWVHPDVVAARSAELTTALHAWVQDWESRDLQRYAGHYSRDFRSESNDYASWIRHKRRVNASKKYIRVGVTELSLFGYPGERDMVVATFDQDYRSDNFSNRITKRQYWRREADGAWRIVYEGVVKLRAEHLRGVPYSARSKIAEITPRAGLRPVRRP